MSIARVFPLAGHRASFASLNLMNNAVRNTAEEMAVSPYMVNM